MRKAAIGSAIRDGVHKYFEFVDRFSQFGHGDRVIKNEQMISSFIADRLRHDSYDLGDYFVSQETNLRLIKSAIEALGRKSLDPTIFTNFQIDVVLWAPQFRPIAIIEVKRKSSQNILKDSLKIAQIMSLARVGVGGTIKHGIVAFAVDAKNKENAQRSYDRVYDSVVEKLIELGMIHSAHRFSTRSKFTEARGVGLIRMPDSAFVNEPSRGVPADIHPRPGR